MTSKTILTLLLVFPAVHCTEQQAPPVDAAAETTRLRAELSAERKRNELERQYIDEATKTINVVHDRLMTLQPLETTLRDVQRNKVEGVAMTPTQREDMLAAIDAVEQSLKRDTKMLEEFRARTQNAEVKVAGLEQTIAKLQTIAEAKNEEIAELRQSLQEMAETVTSLQQAHESDQSELARKTDELRHLTEQLATANSRVYEVRYLRGTVRDLVRQGVLVESRRFLRRPAISLTQDLRFEQFETADLRDLRTVPVAGRSNAITIYPKRPPAAFHIAAQSGNSAELIIDDPGVFWQTRFVVVASDQ